MSVAQAKGIQTDKPYTERICWSGKEDLLKIRHYIDLLIDLEYSNRDKIIDIEQIIEHNTIFRNPNDQIQ